LAYWVGAPSLLGFFSAMFLHGDLMHLFGNMLFLWIFGRALEDVLGPLIYSLAYMVCGIAATLLYHVTATSLSPSSLMVPALGASGAVAGLLGLFAPRFYRTPIHVLYTTFVGWRLFTLMTFVLTIALTRAVGTPGAGLAWLISLAILVLMDDDWLWGEWKVPALWGIGAWFVWNDLLPVLIQMYLGGEQRGGVAHWAHIGGFACGVLYALLIGFKNEGTTEYLVDDARESLQRGHGGNALEHAQQLLKIKPNDPSAHRLVAQAMDARNSDENQALDNWELAIEGFLKSGDRDNAASSYLEAVQKHSTFILPASTQFALGNHMARQGDYIGAAETLVKIPFTFPDAPEGELSLLRSAQIYAQHLHDPKMSHYLLSTLLQRYPQTEWMAQVEQGIAMTKAQMAQAAMQTPPAPGPLSSSAKDRVTTRR
jgi:membrane associated rhomboid family serine protease